MAGQSVDNQSVAGQSVAGQSVAGRSEAGRSEAGQSVADMYVYLSQALRMYIPFCVIVRGRIKGLSVLYICHMALSHLSYSYHVRIVPHQHLASSPGPTQKLGKGPGYTCKPFRMC